MSNLLSTRELCEALGVTRKTLQRWVAAGCPSQKLGDHETAPRAYDLDAVKAWMRATARTGERGRPPAGLETHPVRDGEVLCVDGAALRPPASKCADELDADAAEDLAELLRRVNLQIKQLEVTKRERIEAEARGELVPLVDVQHAWGAQIEVVQARFRALPGALAQRLVGKDYDAIYEALDSELHSVLTAFAREELI